MSWYGHRRVGGEKWLRKRRWSNDIHGARQRILYALLGRLSRIGNLGGAGNGNSEIDGRREIFDGRIDDDGRKLHGVRVPVAIVLFWLSSGQVTVQICLLDARSRLLRAHSPFRQNGPIDGASGKVGAMLRKWFVGESGRKAERER